MKALMFALNLSVFVISILAVIGGLTDLGNLTSRQSTIWIICLFAASLSAYNLFH